MAQLSADIPATFIALLVPANMPAAMPSGPLTLTSFQVCLQLGELVVNLSCPISECRALLREVLQ